MADQTTMAPPAPTDYTQTIAMLAKPVIAAGLTLLGGAGAIHALPADATINAACVFIGALGNAGILGWAYFHSRAITQRSQQQRIAAGAAGYSLGVALPQAVVPPDHPTAIAAGIAIAANQNDMKRAA